MNKPFTIRYTVNAICLTLISLILTFFSHSPLFSAESIKTAQFPEVFRPYNIVLDEERIYITEQNKIHIFSRKDYKPIIRFGKRGEGPREFKAMPSLPVTVDVRTENLLINSIGKISFFTKTGQFIKEIKSPPGFNVVFTPIKNNYVGVGIMQEEGVNYKTFNIYDHQLKKVKEIYRSLFEEQPRGGDINVMTKSFEYAVYKNKIFISGKKEFVLEVMNVEGKRLYSISRDYKLVPFTSQDREKVLTHFKNDRNTRPYYHILKSRVKFPESLPAIFTFFISEDLLYVITYKTLENKETGEKDTELFIFQPEGKELGQTYIPLRDKNTLEKYPFRIYGGKLYQLIENLDEEIWELFVSDIKIGK